MAQNNQDQADLLRKQMEEINQDHTEEMEKEIAFDPEKTQIDILNLPPRRVIHDEKKVKLKFKISSSSVRFIFILLLVIVILVLTFNYWGDYFLNNPF